MSNAVQDTLLNVPQQRFTTVQVVGEPSTARAFIAVRDTLLKIEQESSYTLRVTSPDWDSALLSVLARSTGSVIGQSDTGYDHLLFWNGSTVSHAVQDTLFN